MEYQEIAAKLGVHRVTLFHWMSGNRSPSKENMLIIEAELGWSVADQMAAFNEMQLDPKTGKPTGKDSYGPELRSFLETKFGTPEQARYLEKA